MVRAVAVMITTDRAVYPIWGLGGTVKVTAEGLPSNVPFYLWIQRSGGVANVTNVSFTSVNSASASGELSLGAQTPPGTYILSLSKSQASDTGEAVAHFGVSGTDAANYVRTMMVTVAGGGFV
ncbi:MAG TPA: hypothetical protein VLV31_09415, partial [Candidatus Acidoferrales bacterium]|nr:hypothetical protein [Candidatus Acidoferrales bacterium]